MTSRETRAAALAEKKAKLKALKAKHAARKSTQRAATASVAAATAQKDSTEAVNRFVDDILAAPVPGGSSTSTAAPTSSASLPLPPSTTDSNAYNVTDATGDIHHISQDNATQNKQIKYAALTLATSVSVVHLPGRQADMYDKGTQTTEVVESQAIQDTGTHRNANNANSSKVRQTRSPRGRRKSTRIGEEVASSNDPSISLVISSTASLAPNTTATANSETAHLDLFLKNAKRVLDTNERTTIEQSEPFCKFLSSSTSVVERMLNQSDSFDPTMSFGGAYDDEEENDRNKSEANIVKIREFYHDKLCSGRSVTDLAWSPHYKELFLTAMGARDLQTQRRAAAAPPSSSIVGGGLGSANNSSSAMVDSDGMVLVWSINRHQAPEFIFRCQSAITTAKFDPFSPNLIVGATFSGQVVLWDKRAKSQPVQRTPLSASGHTHPIFSLDVVGSTNANKLVTISTDGKMCSWSLGALSEPTDSTMLSASDNKSEVAVTSMSFAAGDSNEFCAGAENGGIYSAQVHGQKKVKRYNGHYGPITSLMFHPGHQLSNVGGSGSGKSGGSGGVSGGGDGGGGEDKETATSTAAATEMNERERSLVADHSGRAKSLLLSSSVDWTVRLWSHQPRDGQQPLREVANFRSARDYVYDVRWSPVHPGMFAYVDGGGWLHVWDVNVDMEEPVIKIQATDGCAAVKIRFTGDGKGLIVGDSTGVTHYFSVKEHSSLSRVNAWIKLSKLNHT